MEKYKRNIYAIHLLNDYSGSPRVLADAINVLSENGNCCNILTSQHEGFLNAIEANRFLIPYFKFDNRYLVLFSYVLSQCYCFLYLSFLLAIDRLRGIRTTVIVNTMLPFGACIAAKIFAGKCVVYIHETSISPKGLKVFLRAVINYCADNVIYVSEYLAKSEVLKKPVSFVLYNGLRKDLFFNLDFDSKAKFDGRSILFCGSLKSYKGIFQFIELARRMKEFKFVAALNCKSGDLISLTDIPSNLTLCAQPKNLQELYERAFLVVNLSIPEQWVETFGLSLLEGMSAGCPVVAPPVGGPTEFVNNDVGLCIDSSDLKALENYIRLLGSNYDNWYRCSIAASRRAKSFSAETYKDNLLQIFNSLEFK